MARGTRFGARIRAGSLRIALSGIKNSAARWLCTINSQRGGLFSVALGLSDIRACSAA